ncbi:MAG: hypothetical protein ABIS84_14585 [Arachnia sp.]
MMGYGWGMGVGGWIAMGIFWVALLVLIVWLVTRAFSPGITRGSRGEHGPQESADQVLDRRFAAGEIDEPTYHRMREALRSGRSQHNMEL